MLNFPMFEELLVKALGNMLLEGLGILDFWWSKVFGVPLSGRINRIEIQTLFHGNTKDEDQI